LGKRKIETEIEKIKSKKKENSISGDTIKAFREKLGLSQTKFARLLGRNHSTISYWESEEISPSQKSRKALEELAEKNGIDLKKLEKEKKEQ